MTKFLPFVPPVLRLFVDDALWETFVAHEFWKAHHSSADQKAANDVTLVLLKKNLQFLIDNAATLQDTLGVNFLDPGLQMDLLVRVGYNRRHLHRKLTGTEQEQKWKSLVADSNVDHQNLDQLNRVAVVMEARRMQRKYADGSLKLAGSRTTT